MNIHGFITLTLLDYPEHLAASIFLGGTHINQVMIELIRTMNLPFLKRKYLLFSKKEAVFSKVSVSAAVNLRCIANFRIL